MLKMMKEFIGVVLGTAWAVSFPLCWSDTISQNAVIVISFGGGVGCYYLFTKFLKI